MCGVMRAQADDAKMVGVCCLVLSGMLINGLDATVEILTLAKLAARMHPAYTLVQESAADLIQLLPSSAAPSVVSVSPAAALARVAHSQVNRDFASLVLDMDAFPELEELQQAGCIAMYGTLMIGDAEEEAAAAGAVECVVRALDLFQHSAETQLRSLAILNVLFGSHASVMIAGNAGATRLAVRALRSFPEDISVIHGAFSVLDHLTSFCPFREEALNLNALVLCLAALRLCAKHGDVQGVACSCMASLCGGTSIVPAADAHSMGALELVLSVLRNHRSNASACSGASLCLHSLCYEEAHAVNAQQLGAPLLLQAAMKAHLSRKSVQLTASEAQARIQRFVDAACARAEANMAELIAGEEAAKEGKAATAAPKNDKKGKGKGHPAPPPPPPPLAVSGEPVLTKAQIRRRKAKAAAAARKPAAASDEDEGEAEERSSYASSSDSEPRRPRPPLDFSRDSAFRRSLKLPPRDVEAEIDEIIAQHEALLLQRGGAQPPGATEAPPQPPPCEAVGGAAPRAAPFAASSSATAPQPPLPAAASPVADTPPPPAPAEEGRSPDAGGPMLAADAARTGHRS